MNIRPVMNIRPTEDKDLNAIHEMIHELADYEKLAHVCKITVKELKETLQDKKGSTRIFISELDGQAAGYMIAFFNYSTFLGKKGVYLEDLYVRPQFRGRGLGKYALAYLADYAVKHDCRRMEWVVLDWNKPSIDFYESIGAKPVKGWTIFRMQEEELKNLAAQSEALSNV